MPGLKCVALLGVMVSISFVRGAFCQSSSKTLPGTKPLTIGRPLDEVMVAGISRFALQAMQQSPLRRDARWSRDYASVGAYVKSVDPNRERLRTIIGAVDQRETADGFELVAKLGHDGVVARSNNFVVYA